MPQQCLSKDIKIRPAGGELVVRFDGEVIARSTRALALDEPGAPLRYYIPRADVTAEALADSPAHTTCPYKGEASYHSLKSPSGVAKDAAWYYSSPCALAEPVRDHLAFWGNRIQHELIPG